SFAGADPAPLLEPFDRLDTRVSYFLGSDPAGWHADVPVWGGVRYRDLYPGIDLEVTSAGGELLPRLVAQPGADLSMVRLRVQGAEGVDVRDGQMRIRWAGGEVGMPLLAPVASAEGGALPVDAGPQVSTAAGEVEDVTSSEIAYPFAAPAAPLSASAVLTGTADLIYSTYIGGSSDDRSWNYNGLAVDAAGAAYVTGYTYSSNFPFTPGSYNPTFRGHPAAAFVLKMNPAGSALAYATFLGGAGTFYGQGIAVDSTGAAYVSWHGKSDNAAAMHSVQDPEAAELYNDVFVSKLSPTGTALLYSLRVGGNHTDFAGGLAVDASGAAYVNGSTSSANFPTPGGFDTTYGGGNDAFLVKVRPNGTGLVYGTFIGGSKSEWDGHVAVGGNGAAYVVGTTFSSDFPTTPGALDRTFGGGDNRGDAFVVKVNAAGNDRVYATYLGGGSYDEGRGIALGAGGVAYVTGMTASANFPTTEGVLDRSCGCDLASGIGDGFVAKLNAAGSGLVYSTFLGGSSSSFNDAGTSIAVSPWGVAYVTGWTQSSDFPTTVDAYDRTHNSVWSSEQHGNDAFVLLLNETGSAPIYSTFLGGHQYDDGYAIAVGPDGAAYVRGYTASTDFPTTLNAYDRTANGRDDMFMAKLLPWDVGRPVPSATPTNTPTPTRTPTSTRTPTVTRTPTSTPTPTLALPDLVADGLEVTQALQDLNNSVRLVAGKATYVRFHVHSTSGLYSTDAQLHVSRDDGAQITLTTNPVLVRPRPDRGVLDHAFLFELPDAFTEREVTLTAEVNPQASWRRREPIEATYDNNTASATVSFETVPPINVVIYRVSYDVGDKTYIPATYHIDRLTGWLRSGYPVSTANFWYRTYHHGSGLPDCRTVDLNLLAKRLWDRRWGWLDWVPANARYYGLVHDGGGFMRGCALGIPSSVASGPAGGATFGWDTDGSYGDWYGAHELGHAYGLVHSQGTQPPPCGNCGTGACNGRCGCEAGAVVRNPNGSISPTAAGQTAVYGFDVRTSTIYDPSWKDLMTYCQPLWIGDSTYEWLMDYIQAGAPGAQASALSAEVTDRLLVVGSISNEGEVRLDPLF
ncbi:MAG: SBBP repeat-containing protein, partial [Anaerolineae bacterium]|nr:SBBP repeat-containing protein [Anaerolineae bacterium]